MLVAISEGIGVAKYCCNKILHFLAGTTRGCRCVVVVILLVCDVGGIILGAGSVDCAVGAQHRHDDESLYLRCCRGKA